MLLESAQERDIFILNSTWMQNSKRVIEVSKWKHKTILFPLLQLGDCDKSEHMGTKTEALTV